MRLWRWASLGVLSLSLGIPAVRAQDEKPRPAEPAPEPARPDTAKPAQPESGAMKQEQPKPEEGKPAQQEKSSREVKQQQKSEDKAAKDEAKQGGHPAGAQTAAGKGAHIPDDQFKAHFGRQHTLVIHQPTVVEGQPRFQYSGYWFVISDPWPVGWAYTDQCYIDSIDGEYFLFDLLHPGVQIGLLVVM